MSKLAKVLTNKEIKELLKEISGVMNDYDQWQISNGDAWGYVLKLNKNKDIEMRIYDEIECESCNYVITIPSDNITEVKDIIKGCINFLYDQELNWRNSCLKGNKGWFSRKHKSINLWLIERNNEAKALEISKQIAERYSNSKRIESDISHFKVYISRMYFALNCLDKNWKLEDIKNKTLDRCQTLNINNVGISYIDSTIICMRSNDKATKVIDKFEIPVDRDFCNISATVNMITSRLRKCNIA